MKTLNLVGRQVGKLRYERGWTQEELTDRLQLAGWKISRSGLSKIENCTLYVPEFRLFYFAHVFDLSSPMPLFPNIDPRQPVHDHDSERADGGDVRSEHVAADGSGQLRQEALILQVLTSNF